MNDNEINKKLRSIVNSALDKYFVNDFEKAIQKLKSAEMLDPENPEILHNLAVCHSRMGLHKTAIKYGHRLLKAETGYIDTSSAKKMLAFSLVSIENYREALSLMDEILRDSPDDETALAMKAYCLDRTGNSGEAVETYRKIITLNPDNYSAMNSIAYLLIKKDGDVKEAMKFVSAALKAKPGNAAYLDTMGCVLMKTGDYARAETAFLKALKLQPGEKEIIENKKELEKIIRDSQKS